MLNVNEIRNLEEKWKRYRRKRFLKFFFIAIFTLFIVALCVWGYVKFFDESSKKTPILKSEKVILKTKAKKKVVKSHIISAKKSSQKPTIKSKSIVEDNDSDSDILRLDAGFLDNIHKEKSKAKKLERKKDIKKDNNTTDKMIKNQQNKIDKQAKILISSQKVDEIKFLEERYLETNKVSYAILLSKEYYKQKKYIKSLYWASIANNIDSLNEDSWIMFAKNKVKLGKKDDAINALIAYLRVNNSKKARRLLVDIKNGVFK